MGRWVGDLYGMGPKLVDYKVSASVAEGVVMMREATATDPGEVEVGAATAALNCLGCSTHAVTYSATQNAVEGLAKLIPLPFGIWRFRIVSGATATGMLATDDPGNILTNTVASAGGTLISSANVGTINQEGGLMIGRFGANAGVVRKIAAHVNSVSETVTVPFPRAIAAGDLFIRVPYSRTGVAMQTTTDMINANGVIAVGTGIPVQIPDIIWDRFQEDVVEVDVCFRTSYHNSLA